MLQRSLPSLRRQLRLAVVAYPIRQQRLASSQPSAHTSFYKTFGRPIVKVFLIAVFTYQLAYFGWVKLEQDETRAERTAEIAGLEEKVKSLEAAGAKR